MTCSLCLEPLARFVTGGAGARPDYPISGHSLPKFAVMHNSADSNVVAWLSFCGRGPEIPKIPHHSWPCGADIACDGRRRP
jgi:hypothetical protein